MILKRITSILLLLFINFSCAENKPTADEDKNTQPEPDMTSIESSRSAPKSSQPLRDLEPVKESDKSEELILVPNRDALKEIQERKKKKEEQEKKESIEPS